MNPKQRRFIDEYLIDHNATQAAIRAGYSEKTARSIGAKLLTKVDILVDLSNKEKEVAARNALKQDDIVHEMMKMAFMDTAGMEPLLRYDVKYKALDWLSRYFTIMPLDKHRIDYDNQRLEIDMLRAKTALSAQEAETQEQDNQLADALGAAAAEVWPENDDPGTADPGPED